EPEMDPASAHLQAFLTALGVRMNRLQLQDVGALGHGGRRACSARKARSIAMRAVSSPARRLAGPAQRSDGGFPPGIGASGGVGSPCATAGGLKSVGG